MLSLTGFGQTERERRAACVSCRLSDQRLDGREATIERFNQGADGTCIKNTDTWSAADESWRDSNAMREPFRMSILNL